MKEVFGGCARVRMWRVRDLVFDTAAHRDAALKLYYFTFCAHLSRQQQGEVTFSYTSTGSGKKRRAR